MRILNPTASGSLNVSGSLTVTGSTNISGSLTVTGSTNISGSVYATSFIGDVEIRDTLTLTTYDEGTVSVSSDGRVKTEPAIQTLSLGEGYADVAKEYHIADGKTVYPNSLSYMYAELLRLNLLSKTSLILTPTAIETGIVASQKPLSSDGDFTFTRSTAATRVNENGYIEKETQNLLLQSNTFDTTWNIVRSSVTSGATDPFGGTNAWSFLADNTADQQHYIYQVISQSGVGTFSIYAKANGYNWMRLRLPSEDAFFDLANGVIGSNTSGISASMTNVGNGWYRCEVAISDMSTNPNIFIHICASDNNIFISGTPSGSDGLYIYGAQLEQGLVARDYIETTTSAVYGGITDNVPRIDYTDYLNPSLLLEPSRTNNLTHSEYIAAGFTSNGGMLIESNSVASPENFVNATKMTRPNGTGAAWLTNVIGGVVGQKQVLSVYAKAGTATIFNITYYDATTGDLFFNYDLSVGSVSAPTGSAYYVDSSIEDVGNGWYRCIAIVETANTGQFQMAIGNNRYGAANEYLYVYGTQWESNASYPTSYIPTYGISVTRNADFSTADITSALSSNQGTLFIHLDDDADSGGYSSGALSIGLLDTAETVWVGWASNSPASTELRGIYRVGGSTTFVGASTPINTECKLLIKWGGGTVSFFKNGSLYNTQSVTDFSGQPLEQYQLPKQIRAGNYPIKQTLIFPTALTDSECIALTKIN